MILGFAHPAIVVPDLDRAREFYERMFGFRYLSDESWEDDPVADQVTGLARSACRGVMLAGHNCYLELFEFVRPEATPGPAQGPQAPGIRHLCFFVDNCRAELERLLSLGGKPLGEPADVGGGAWVVYCRDPFGNIIELAEPPGPDEDLRQLPGVAELGTFAG
mgnify:FL=1